MTEGFVKNVGYVHDEVSYICIGFTKDAKEAVLAPYWADDEDSGPDIQNDDYLVVENRVTDEYLSLGLCGGRLTME
ncbi:hypothetical protein [Paenibacillus agilis]|uniref:Uncharacterized protein n=1 Tax=Paenibacillus agilis TaxID=3020863 RepID=A0A559IZG6_9BACL|nr:hypothetical protein [Paenibacillus agilis]TVX93012.1 hypothetical protein FPZ44_08045 [Paenibacillus agilis]